MPLRLRPQLAPRTRRASIERARALCAALILFALAAHPALATPEPETARDEPTTERLCTADELGAAVDRAGERLRTFNEEATPDLQRRLRQLATAKGWGSAATDQRAMDYLMDAKVAAFDRRAGDLLARIDTLSRTDAVPTAPCSTIANLEAASLELLAVMKAKLAHIQGKISAEIGSGEATVAQRDPFGPAATRGAAPDPFLPDPLPDAQPSVPEPPAPSGSEPSSAAEPPANAKLSPSEGAPAAGPSAAAASPPVAPPPAAPKPATPKPAAPPPESEVARRPEPAARPPAVAPREPRLPATPQAKEPEVSAWSTTTERAPEQPPASPETDIARLDPGPGLPGGEPGAGLPSGEPGAAPRQGYTMAEIREASQGFFGTVSTGLASVIEYAFQTWGRPTAYILGEEGGGAFLAGLRYGKGTLYPRFGEAETIYWHGPSLGYDFGAAGSRTLILVYGTGQPEELYRSFTGLDGSAYLVGGVGLTLMTSGSAHIAPIRSGLGLRLGANIGYIRFAPQPTWNPF